MSALMNIGTRAMFANYAALQTTGSNIANANTAGYSRQQVELATAQGQSTGAGFFGRGVTVQTVSRAEDAFLTREAAVSRAGAAQDSARLDQLQRLEKVFPPGEQGLGYSAGQLLNAFVDVANRPQDISARQVVLARAEELASRFRDASTKLDTLQSGVSEDVRNSVATVNELARKVASLNQQIAAAQGTGNAPNDLLDQRDQLVSEISEQIQVTTVAASDGSLSVFVGGGQRLVLGSQSVALKAVPDEFDPAQVQLAVAEIGGDRLLSPDVVSGGRIAGLLKFQSSDLRDARALIGQMASAVAGSLNDQQSLGLDLRQPAGAGAPLLAVGAPRVLPASGNSWPSPVTITVTNARQLQASDYSLRADPANAGQYLLTRLTDGQVSSIAPGATVDGMRIDIGLPAPAASDRFLLQPVSQAGSGMARVLDDPRGIAAASQMTASLDASNTGTATVASLKAVSTTLDPTLTTDITFTDDSGNYAYLLTGPGGIVAGTGSWTAGQPISLNGYELRLSGVPRSGDTLQVAPTAFPASNNGNALALLGLRDQGIVGEEALAGGGVSPGETVTDAYARAMADIGVRVQGAKSSSDITSAVAANAKEALSSRTGVNLDEEAARLIQYQQGYQAAAKVLQIAQSVFDTLLQAAGR
jgi:flagellar hook-associated protein 1 FlgK